MNIAVWIVQGLLALAFFMTGILKIVTPHEKLVTMQPWANDFSPQNVKLIGLVEILGAIGLILPSALGILPWLTPVAAIGLAIVMLLAMFTHGRRSEFPNIGGNAVLLLLALFVIYGRFIAVPL